MLAIAFTGFAICIAGAIGVSRRLVVSSECETFGRLWTKAILSEYDIHLLDDYSIMGDLFPKVRGMKSIDAREIVVDELKKLGALVSIEDYMHNVGTLLENLYYN